MQTLKNSYSLIIALSFLFFSYFISVSHSPSPIYVNKDIHSINLKGSVLSLFHFGQKRLLSSLIWTTTILQSDTHHHKKKDQNSWIFERIQTINKIDPHFYESYLFGGQYLSIIKDDIKGAEIIYDNGLKQFTDDFWLNLNGGFHYLFEVKSMEKAMRTYEKIETHPLLYKVNPLLIWTMSRLKKKLVGPKESYQFLLAQYNGPILPELKKKIEKDLYSLKAQIDLDCLNSKKAGNCSKRDFEGNFYQKKEGLYFAQKQWTPFKSFDFKKN